MRYIKKFENIRLKDVKTVGGKNASLGEMITQLSSQGIRIPTGFAITADAYWHFLQSNDLIEKMKHIMRELKKSSNITVLKKVGLKIRRLILNGHMPDDLAQEIIAAYHELSQHYHMKNCAVAVRSSATAEDLPNASFAGQQDTFLNITSEHDLLQACKKSMASLFNDRAIIYRIEQKFDHFKVALSIGVQKMIRSSVSGVAFSLDTESGFKDVVMIEASYGLGESIVQGIVTPDEYIIHKPTLELGYASIIKKVCGDKKTKIVYGSDGKATKTVKVSIKEQHAFALSDKEIIELAHFIVTIEKYYSALKKSWSPMDIEWAKDSNDGKLYIVQARPETIYAGKKNSMLQYYVLQDNGSKKVITTGLSIGHKIVSGVARVVQGTRDIGKVCDGDIIVTPMTDPDWVPVMKRAAGIVTDRGGRTCHAAIVSRELGIPAIVGTKNGTKAIKNGDLITIDCSQSGTGTVYRGKIKYKISEASLAKIAKPPVDIMINIADPDSAFQASQFPVDGVGLARIEFIITHFIKIHPMALLHPECVKDKKVKNEIDTLTASYNNKTDFFVEQLAQNIGMIAAAFYPRPVIVRLSDFKSNEYRNLLGGVYFEPIEENPMIGFRGASRYYHEYYKEAFALECKALLHARKKMGLKNIKIMIPFVRTVQEAQLVINEMKLHGLAQGNDDLEIVMMCEVPSNVIMIDELSSYFDGFSIGSNDLTQLILGVDRDSEMLASLFDERNQAVKKMMMMAIKGAHKNRRYIGICGQAPSDFPDLAEFLIKAGIDSISLNVDSVLSFLTSYKKKY